MSTSNKRWPGDSLNTYPDVFNIKAMPPQPSAKKPGQLPENMIRQFFEKGYVIVDTFFNEGELNACRDAIAKQVDHLAQTLHKAGKIGSLYEDYGLFQRLTHMEKEFPGANVVLIKSGLLAQGGKEFNVIFNSHGHIETYLPKEQAFKDLWSNPRLLNVVEQIIGPDIMGHPVWNLRTKLPRNEVTTVPWHQDAAYLDNRSYGVMQVTAWIPLLDANRDNGCMEVASGGHLKGKVASHTCCWGDTWYVMLEEEEMAKTLGVDLTRDVVSCPVPYGGMLLMNNLIPHRSLPNVSKDIRWSLDLRWQRPDQPVGLFDVKEGILLRAKDQPNMQVDWQSYEKTERQAESEKFSKKKKENADENDAFDITLHGPWMKKWEIVNPNRHTALLSDEELAPHLVN